MSSLDEVPAYSRETDTTYESWDALVAAEANGYVIVGITEREGRPMVAGPFTTQEDAKRAQPRLRRAWLKEEQAEHGANVRTYIQVLWKDGRW